MGIFSSIGDFFSNPINALVGAVGGPALLGTGLAVGSSALSYMGQKSANDQATRQAQEQMKFQEWMSSTAHQREVADLKAAGLNPILSGTGGPGASTPVGAKSEPKDAIGPAVNAGLQAFSTGMNAGKTMAEIAKIQAETPLTPAVQQSQIESNYGAASSAKSQARLNTENAILQKQRNILGQAQKEMDKLDLGNVGQKIQNHISDQELLLAKREVLRAKNEGEIDATKFGKAMAIIDRALKPLSPVIPLWKRH